MCALVKGYPVIDGVAIARRVSFARFPSRHSCSYGIYAIGNNPESPDAVHPLHMTATNKYSVDIDALAFMYEPDPEWRVQEVRQQSSDKWEEEEEEDNGAG